MITSFFSFFLFFWGGLNITKQLEDGKMFVSLINYRDLLKTLHYKIWVLPVNMES